MVAHSYDLVIITDGRSTPVSFGPKGGLDLGNALKEPSAPTRVDTVLIQSLHHGHGREIATDPNMLRDANGQDAAADTRQIGFIMPSGAITLLDTVAINDAVNIEVLAGYAAVFTTDAGNVVFGAGNQIITIDVTDDSVTNANTNISGYFTGSAVEWNRDMWLGVADASAVTVEAYNYDEDTISNSNVYMFSWAASTRNSIFWIRNRSGAAPQFRWSDRTDQDFGNFNSNFIYPNNVNAYVLEIPKAEVTGMGVAGQYALFASKGGNIWGFDRNEVFIPLSPQGPGGFIDRHFGGQMPYVGSWLLVPNADGLSRFDPRNISLTDITPPIHQGATPGIGTAQDKSIKAASPTPTGAVVIGNLIGADDNLSYIEMYEDGMFYHLIQSSIPDTSRVWGMVVTRGLDSDGNFTSALRCYLIGADDTYTNWNIYRVDLANAAWAPGPESLAAVSGFRTGFYSARPPDVNVSATQLRGYAKANDTNTINLYLEVDNAETQYPLGIITTTGPFVLPVPANVLPGRKFAIAGNLNVADDSEDPCFLELPLSLDYRYVQASSALDPDYVTLKFEASSDRISNIIGREFTHGRDIADYMVVLSGETAILKFNDAKQDWAVVIENSSAVLIYQEDGRTAPSYLVTMICRRTG